MAGCGVNLRPAAALLAFSLSLPSTVGAGQPASAAHAPRAPAATQSIAELRAAAVSGSADAEYELAERLAVDGVDEHWTEAILWLERAAAQGHADAQTHLSWAYHTGVGVKTNHVEAVKWERLAAEKGQASAQYYLGSDYEFGLGGLPKDAAKAAYWYRRAAEQNHPIAQARLGDLYAEGRGVPRDDTEALGWYLRAMLQKDFGGQLGLGRMCAAGRGVPKDEKEALRWFERAADREAAIASSALLNEDSEMSEALKRDYFLAFSAERHSGRPGPSREWADLSARLLALERAENERTGKPTAAPVAKPEDFCPRLAAVMAAGTANFATLRGKGSEAEGWEATEALPGMHPCSVQSAIGDDAPPFTYRCTVAEGVDASAARAILEGTQRLVTQCLGASWHADELRHPHHVAVLFSKEKSPPELELSQLEGLHSKYEYDLALAISAPLAPLTLERSRPGGAIDLDSPVDFKSEQAGAGNVVRAFRDLLGSDLFIDAGLTGKVTLDRKGSPLREVLDAVCAQVGCVWSFDTNRKRPALHIERKKP